MKATHLRIGNLVNKKIIDDLDPRKEWHEAAAIDAQDLVWLEENPNDVEEFQPIPLTSELLLNAIFLEIGVYEIFERFIFIWKKKLQYWYVYTTGNEYLTNIEYFHEYQNFILALTRKEIIIKELIIKE